MAKKSLTLWLIISVFFSGLVLTGCSNSALKIGWMENSGFSHKTAQYTTFTGTEQTKICVDDGETVSLDYQVTVEKGSLTIALERPDNTMYWENTFTQDASDAFLIETESEQCFELQITGEETGGSFDISW